MKQGADRLVVVQQGQIVSVGTMKLEESQTRLLVSGLTPEAAGRLIGLTRADAPVAVGTMISLSTAQTIIAPGGLVTGEVNLAGAA